jgi:hypothetical protein
VTAARLPAALVGVNLARFARVASIAAACEAVDAVGTAASPRAILRHAVVYVQLAQPSRPASLTGAAEGADAVGARAVVGTAAGLRGALVDVRFAIPASIPSGAKANALANQPGRNATVQARGSIVQR